jgi:hypothetical protein
VVALRVMVQLASCVPRGCYPLLSRSLSSSSLLVLVMWLWRWLGRYAVVIVAVVGGILVFIPFAEKQLTRHGVESANYR